MSYLFTVKEFVSAYYNGSANGVLSIYIKGYHACFRLASTKMLLLSQQDSNYLGLNFSFKRNTRKNKNTIDNIKTSGFFGLEDSNGYSMIIKKEASLVTQEIETIIKAIYPKVSEEHIEIIWHKNNELVTIEQYPIVVVGRLSNDS